MKLQLIPAVKCVVDYIVKNKHYKTPTEIDVRQGSESGDGYIAKTYAISIKGKYEEAITLFVKYLPETVNVEWSDSFKEAFRKEFKFYNVVYPTLKKFEDEKHVSEPFNNVPNYYSTPMENLEAPPIVLENLKSLGYTLRDRTKPVDADHLKLPIKAFARYHALSYALKDQKPEVLEELCVDMEDFFSKNIEKFGTSKMIINCVKQFLDSLDPVSDKIILDRCENLSDILMKHLRSIPQYVDDYAAISQGDCWSNNMMFLYDNVTGIPVDVKLVDWQCQRFNSPVLDFAYFFYTLATKEILDNADFYINLYYEYLSRRIEELGSDPEKMYPYEIFMEHWKKVALFGLTMAFGIVKVQLFEREEVPDLLNGTENIEDAFTKVLIHQDVYLTRMKDLVQYFIDKQLL